MPTSRIEAFSDGVFAIAITLLVLDIHPPTPTTHLWHELGQLWPSYVAYVISFFTIGVIWVNHHRMFDLIVRADRTLMFLNLLLLAWVAFIPFPTTLLATYFKADVSKDIVSAVYAATFLAMGLSFFAIWTYVTRSGLLREDLSPTQVRLLRRRNGLGQVFYAIAVGIAFASPVASFVICGLVALYYVHPGRAAVG